MNFTYFLLLGSRFSLVYFSLVFSITRIFPSEWLQEMRPPFEREAGVKYLARIKDNDFEKANRGFERDLLTTKQERNIH